MCAPVALPMEMGDAADGVFYLRYYPLSFLSFFFFASGSSRLN